MDHPVYIRKGFFTNGSVYSRVADPGGFYPDPDPTFEIKPDLDSNPILEKTPGFYLILKFTFTFFFRNKRQYN